MRRNMEENFHSNCCLMGCNNCRRLAHQFWRKVDQNFRTFDCNTHQERKEPILAE